MRRIRDRRATLATVAPRSCAAAADASVTPAGPGRGGVVTRVQGGDLGSPSW